MPRSSNQNSRLKKLVALSRLKAKRLAPGRYSFLPTPALRASGRSPVEYVRSYFRKRITAPFVGPFAAQYKFRVEEPSEIVVRSRSKLDLISAIQAELDHFHYYLSNFLTHPLYGEENEIGFCRGETVRPIDLREITPGVFRFHVEGIVIGRRDMFKHLSGPYKDGPEPSGNRQVEGSGMRVFIMMPSKPDAAEVDRTEWYDFRPSKWRRKHPRIPLRGPIPIRLSECQQVTNASPNYDRLYKSGLLRIGFVFGYDSEGHEARADAHSIWKIATSPASHEFTVRETGPFGYHGRGLGFSDPVAGKFEEFDLRGSHVLKRGAGEGHGPVSVRYRLAKPLRVGGRNAPEGTIRLASAPVAKGTLIPAGTFVERLLNIELRIYNFDQNVRKTSSQKLIEQFITVFEHNDVVHYDGHANYGGGFFVGERSNDILWADAIGLYRHKFSKNYQVFSIGACHAAGYFADLFYNELHPRKTPKNLDIIAAINETSFADAVQQSLEVVSYLLQFKKSGTEASDYLNMISAMSKPADFQAYIGVFAKRQQFEVRSDELSRPHPVAKPLARAASR